MLAGLRRKNAGGGNGGSLNSYKTRVNNLIFINIVVGTKLENREGMFMNIAIKMTGNNWPSMASKDGQNCSCFWNSKYRTLYIIEYNRPIYN